MSEMIDRKAELKPKDIANAKQSIRRAIAYLNRAEIADAMLYGRLLTCATLLNKGDRSPCLFYEVNSLTGYTIKRGLTSDDSKKERTDL